MGKTPSLLTTTQAAARVGVTPAYVRLLALTGKVPYQRVGPLICVRSTDMDAWDRSRREKADRRLARKAAGEAAQS